MSSALLWFLAGLALILLEFAAPGVIVVFFGIGAWVTALLLTFLPLSLTLQLLIFLIVSVASVLLLRSYALRVLNRKTSDEQESDEAIGAVVVVRVRITADHPGAVFFGGTTWTAESDQVIEAGEKVRVTGRNGLVLTVESIDSSEQL
ncbi:MAG: NfeD family protein [Spirochaetia bacterium]|nr:NfeD family protein [Spirochaetia bacterium]MCF7941642.1 NfeD family protein [Spirochaetia bacterium]